MKTKFTDDIKILFEYNNRTIITEVKPYKKISKLIKIEKQLFNPIKKPIRLIYQNQDLKQFDSFLIRDILLKKIIFKNCTKN